MKKTSLVSTSSIPPRNGNCLAWKCIGVLIATLLSLASVDSLRAGTFSNSFNADPSAQININLPAMWVASGSYDGSGYISLTDAINSQNNGSIVLPDLDSTAAIGGFLATFKLRIGGGTARPADGLSVSFGPEVTDSSQAGEEGLGSGIIICFDTWDNNAPDTAPAIDVKVGGNAEGNIIATAFMDGQREGNRAPPGPLFTDPSGNPVSLGTGTNFVDVRMELRDGLFNLSFKGIEIFKNLPVTFAPIAGRFLFGARTGGANDNHWIDDLQITTFPPSAAPTVTRFAGSAAGFEITITNGSTQVQSASVRTALNGTNVVSTATSAGGITSVKYTAPTLLPAGSTHSVTLTYSDSANLSRTNTFSFTVAQYTVVSPDFATPTGAVSTNTPGFNARVHQISVTRTPGDANSPANAERQIADGYIDPATGQPYPNLVDLTGATNGIFAIDTYINWNNGPPVSAGNFSDIATPPADDPVPGIPAAGDNIVAEILTFLDLKAGLYRMGVNSDDGFKVTTGKDPRDVLSAVLLGQFPTGRGAADTLFDFVIQTDGIYPFRLLWWEGGGDASVEWFAVNPSTGQKILINDRTDPAGIRAYRQGATLPYVKSANPLPNATGVALNTNITITIADGSTRLVQPASVQLFLNGMAVTPIVTKPAGTNTTTVVYDPPGDLQPERRYSVRLIYGDNSTPPILVTNEYSFVSSPTFVTLFAIDDRTMWRYDRSGLDLGTAWKEKIYNDSAWPEGAALIGEEPGATVEPLRTPIMRFNDSGEYVETFYYRTHFTLTNDPASVRLQLRHVLDDGGIFYLNGVEVHRFGYAAGVTVLFDNSGAGGHENAYEGPFSIPTTSLVAGDNVFAVEVHQSGTGSSDTVFGAELLAITSRAPDPVIESTVPAANSLNVALNTIIEIIIVDGVQQIQPNSIQLFFNGQAVTPAVDKPLGSLRTKVTYDPPGDLPQNTSNSVRLIYGDNSTPPVLRTNEFSFTTTGPSVLIFTFNDTQLWSYENTGQELGTAWKEKNYNDSAWPKGAALLGLNTDNTHTAISSNAIIRTPLVRTDPVNGAIVTDYFRTHFNFTGDPATSQLRVTVIVDDSVVLYLNGNEILNLRVPAVRTKDTLGGGHEASASEGPFLVPATGLVQGDNVLAAEVHQSSTDSSDIVFGVEVSAVIPGGTQPAPRITSARLSAGTITVQWSNGGTLESAPAVTGPWTTTNDSDGSFSEAATGAGKYYRVRR